MVGLRMSKSTEHRKHAQECRALAHNVQNEGHKTQLLKMANAWDSFAVERERQEQQEQKDEALEGHPAPNGISKPWTGGLTNSKPESKPPKARFAKSMPR